MINVTDKCNFLEKSVTWLSHILNATDDGVVINPSDDSIKTSNEYLTPKSKREIKRLVGAVNYLHHFMDRFSEISTLLTDLLTY